jgi:cytoskeletal protein RodZ
MANKRIELEQYKHYVNLLHEEPPRKTVRKGVTICFIVMMLFCIGLFVLAVLSNSLATNPSNILEKPPAAPSSTPGTQVPNNTQQVPIQQQQQQVPIQQSPSPGSKAPVDSATAVRDTGLFGIPVGTKDGDLVAQASTSSPVVTIPDTNAPTGSTPSTAPKAKKPTATPLPTTNKGAGSLAKLTNGAGGRGLQIYALVLAIGLIVILYLGMHRSRRAEGRAK